MNDRKFWLVANTVVMALNLIGAAFALYVWLGGPLAGF